MGVFLLYLFKSTCFLTLFYIGFKAFLTRETFYRFNRFVLLSGIILCLFLPFIQLPITSWGPVQETMLQLNEVLNPGPEINGAQEPTITGKEGRVDMPLAWLLGGIYGAGALVNAILLIRSLTGMTALIRRGRQIRRGNYILSVQSGKITAFSFGKYIVLSEEDYALYPEEILSHEFEHIRHRHTFDLIFMEIILLVHWFNPAVWLLKRELQDVHEFQADQGVLQKGIDATKYQLLLVKKAVGSSSYTLANSFNHSKIKKRITMMLKEKSNRWARLKLFLLLPAGFVVAYAFASPAVVQPLSSLEEDKGINILQKEEVYTPEEPVVKVEERREVITNFSAQQPKEVLVKGNVKDEEGKPVIGATIVIKGSTAGTISDPEGNFSLKAPENAELSVSYIDKQTVTVKASDKLSITLYGEKATETPAAATTLSSNEITVKGSVKDEEGKPVAGASVLIKGSTKGTISDMEGNFILKAPADSEISILYIDKETVTVKADKALSITLKSE